MDTRMPINVTNNTGEDDPEQQQQQQQPTESGGIEPSSSQNSSVPTSSSSSSSSSSGGKKIKTKKLFDLENLKEEDECPTPDTVDHHHHHVGSPFGAGPAGTISPPNAPIDESFLRNGYIANDGYLYSKSFMLGNDIKTQHHEPEPLAYHRVDSAEILYDCAPKKAKYIGKYMLGDIIGDGAYSTVKECLDTVTLERRAVKIMEKKRLRKIPNGEKNVQLEIQLLKKLDHINLIKLYDVVYKPEKEKLYIFMDFCVTVLQKLLDSVPEKRLPIHQAHNYFVQLINGLEYLHSHGIIHKDIKPGNLLLSNAGTIKITDFGVSQEIDRFQQSNTIVCSSQGTPSFQPPEIANGRKECSGPAIDIWSSGVTLYNITSGLYPFNSDNIFALFDAIAVCKFDIPPDTDKVLESLLLGLLQKDPAQRFTITQIRQHDWFKKKHPKLEPAVMSAKYTNPYETTSVLPYLREHYLMRLPAEEDALQDLSFDNDQFEQCYYNPEEGFDINERDYEQFSAQLAQAGYPSSSGSIARLNELTINSIMSNASKASKASNTSLKSWTQLFKLKKTKSSKSNLAIDSSVKLSSRLLSGLRISKPN